MTLKFAIQCGNERTPLFNLSHTQLLTTDRIYRTIFNLTLSIIMTNYLYYIVNRLLKHFLVPDMVKTKRERERERWRERQRFDKFHNQYFYPRIKRGDYYYREMKTFDLPQDIVNLRYRRYGYDIDDQEFRVTANKY